MHFSPYLITLRPRQWLKNLMIFFPPFLSGAFMPLELLSRGLLPFAGFCCASSASYIVNDLVDRKSDLAHPVKSKRPIAAGSVPRPTAVLMAVILTLASISIALTISKTFLLYLVIYLVSTTAYSLLLKNLAILDVFCISLGFVLRLYGGGEAFDVLISDWLFLSVFLLAIFLSFGKRYSERRNLGADAGRHRKTLESYPDGFLDSALYLSGASVLVTYAFYAISKPAMVYTVPLCMFGLLRYLMRIKSGQPGDPTDALVKDLPLLITGVLWVVLVGWCAYQ